MDHVALMISNSVFSCVFTLIVFCFKEIDGVGLILPVKSNGIPLEIPPVIPPLWFVEVSLLLLHNSRHHSLLIL